MKNGMYGKSGSLNINVQICLNDAGGAWPASGRMKNGKKNIRREEKGL